LNVLINAWAIGAVPILADQPPYENVEKDELGLLCDPDDPNAWYEKLLEAMTNTALVEKIAKNLETFLHAQYSGQTNQDVIQKILTNTTPIGFATIENRYRAYITLISTSLQSSMQSEMSLSSIQSILIMKIKRRIKKMLARLGFSD
jgi:hypothetical protein